MQMFGTVDAGEEVVVQGSPIIPREVRQASAPPAISAGEKADPQRGIKSRLLFIRLQNVESMTINHPPYKHVQ